MHYQFKQCPCPGTENTVCSSGLLFQMLLCPVLRIQLDNPLKAADISQLSGF